MHTGGRLLALHCLLFFSSPVPALLPRVGLFAAQMRWCAPRLRAAVSGVEESQYFASMRAQILSDLRTNTNDRSLAGRVDPQIAELVEYINSSFTQYVTSSSCGGRATLFHKGITSDGTGSAPYTTAEPVGSSLATDVSSAERRKRGSFGRGTLYQSHDPLPTDTCITVRESIVPALEEFWAWRQAQTSDARLQTTEMLQLKFEPMILHVLCADFQAAAELLKCGSESGQMNSGIVSCSRGTTAHRKITCCITSPLCVDVPLFSHDTWCISPANFRSNVWTTFLTATLSHINALFAENATRRKRFEVELHARVGKAATRQ
ncbi:methyltransferase TYW3, putative [Leishmania tarentolae]|uniref:tRNA(Phe) 7-[(3-amino-3-carboxypropyl)-4-demethylwyosine(37)-N(4)]-methyltransferase n=1 Tax=Leishmania tarentolae TaxID=5689 RepID=A0A640KRS0_LEITA|nr:methyltransferase TYW3, putative [Leishmania tarentolae]